MPGAIRTLPGCLLLGCLLGWLAGAAEPEATGRAPEKTLPPAHGPSLLPGGPLDSPPAQQPKESTPGADVPSPDGPVQEMPRDEPAAKPAEKPEATEDQKGPDLPEEKQPQTPAEQTPAEQPPAKTAPPETPTPPATPPKRVLTPQMTALRDRLRRTLAYYRSQMLNTQEATVTDVLHACLAFGCQTEILRGPANQKINGITCLCWNYPCAGREPLTLGDGHVAPRTGYTFQERPAQMLAMLAQSRVPADYPMRVDQDVRTVADLVAHEKLTCRAGSDLSLKLVGLSYYVAEPSWRNNLDEQWSLERIIKEELAQPVVGAPEGGTTRLLGLCYAVERRAKRKQPIDGEFARAKKFLADFHQFALALQNADGTWGPNFLGAKATSRDPAVQLRSTGCVMEWLVYSLPEERLQDPRVVRSVECLLELLGGGRQSWNLRASSTRDLASVMHALHALSVYDERWLEPAEVAQAEAAPAKPMATARPR